MTLTVTREDDFDFLSPEYAALHAAAGATPFQHGAWLHRVYTTLAPARSARPVVVTVRRAADGALVLVLPLVRTGRLLRTLTFADLGVADYNAVVASPDLLAELGHQPSLAARIRTALGRFDLLRVDRVVGPTDTVTTLLAGSHVRRHHYDTHLVGLASSHAAWRDTLDPAFVRHLDRKHKRLRPKGEQVLRLVTDPAEVEPTMQRLREFRAARFEGRRAVDLVQDDATFAFYRAVAADAAAGTGPGRLTVLDIAGEAVAVALDLDAPDRELFLIVGYDFGRLRNYSLGLLIVDLLARAAIERGKTSLDLTVGDESYKGDFGARPVPLHQVRVTRTVRGRLALLSQDALLRARPHAKRAVVAWEDWRRRRQTPGS